MSDLKDMLDKLLEEAEEIGRLKAEYAEYTAPGIYAKILEKQEICEKLKYDILDSSK